MADENPYGYMEPSPIERDAVADALFDELKLFLAGWLNLEPEEYDAFELYQAAKVMSGRLDVSPGQSLLWKYAARLLGLYGDGGDGSVWQPTASAGDLTSPVSQM